MGLSFPCFLSKQAELKEPHSRFKLGLRLGLGLGWGSIWDGVLVGIGLVLSYCLVWLGMDLVLLWLGRILSKIRVWVSWAEVGLGLG